MSVHQNLESRKQHFLLQVAQVSTNEQAVKNAIVTALQRNKTYAVTGFDGSKIRAELGNEILKLRDLYSRGVTEDEHCRQIVGIADRLTLAFETELFNKRFRIGTVQKALNMYLKTIWCMENGGPTPPHCPVDRVVLTKAGIFGSWTKCDEILVYQSWIASLKAHSAAEHYKSLAEWELCSWTN